MLNQLSILPPTPWDCGIALFNDFDGSLIDIAEHPGEISIAPLLPALLKGVQDTLGGAFALVSGRRINQLDGFFPEFQFACAGVHGAELRCRPGDRIVTDGEVGLQGLAEALRQYFKSDPRILVEDKGLSVALHYRRAPERQVECEGFMQALATEAGLVVQAGKCVLDALSPGVNKGHAVRTLMSAPPFRGRIPVFIGDDLTDEHGIIAAQSLGGYGVKVGSATTAAKFRLPDVAAVHRWLASGLPVEVALRLHQCAGAN